MSRGTTCIPGRTTKQRTNSKCNAMLFPSASHCLLTQKFIRYPYSPMITFNSSLLVFFLICFLVTSILCACFMLDHYWKTRQNQFQGYLFFSLKHSHAGYTIYSNSYSFGIQQFVPVSRGQVCCFKLLGFVFVGMLPNTN